MVMSRMIWCCSLVAASPVAFGKWGLGQHNLRILWPGGGAPYGGVERPMFPRQTRLERRLWVAGWSLTRPPPWVFRQWLGAMNSWFLRVQHTRKGVRLPWPMGPHPPPHFWLVPSATGWPLCLCTGNPPPPRPSRHRGLFMRFAPAMGGGGGGVGWGSGMGGGGP